MIIPISKMMKVKVTQLCLTLCNPMDYTVHRILQARILEWVPFSFSRGSSQPRDWIQVSCIVGRFCTIWATREGCLKGVTNIICATFYFTYTLRCLLNRDLICFVLFQFCKTEGTPWRILLCATHSFPRTIKLMNFLNFSVDFQPWVFQEENWLL